MNFAVVDIETTGRSNRLTELAVVTVDDGQITGKWSSLVNPQELIPRNITWLTGITQEMVSDAPLFEDISEKFLQLTHDRIFVAHSVAFDYGILKSQLSNVGIAYNKNRLCTVRLSRSILPGLSSYSLGKLCSKVGIEVKDRHRALGDALATAELLILLLKTDTNGHVSAALNKQTREATLPPAMDKLNFLNLPKDTGVYRFLDAKGKVLYVGKAKNIRQRVESHFRNYEPDKSALKDLTAKIEFTRTGSELLAFLVEAHDIKLYFPEFNKAAKYSTNAFGLLAYEDRTGATRIGIAKKSGLIQLKGSFGSPLQARDYLKYIVDSYQLCPTLCGLEANEDCNTGSCNCVCNSHGKILEYNKRVKTALATEWQLNGSFLFKLPGRNFKEIAFVLLEDGIYKGYGFVEKEFIFKSTDEIKPQLIPQKNYSEICRILMEHLYSNKTNIEVVELIDTKHRLVQSLH